MRTSTNSRARQRGFTLIELLVVVLLLGLGLGVGLTLDFGSSPQQQKQHTQLLANALELTAQEAVLDNSVLGLDFHVTAEGLTAYRWLRHAEGAWQLYEPEDASAAAFPAGIAATLTLAGQTLVPEPLVELAALPGPVPFSPEILVLPTREVSPFTLTLADAAGNVSVLAADLLGRVRVDEDAPTPP